MVESNILIFFSRNQKSYHPEEAIRPSYDIGSTFPMLTDGRLDRKAPLPKTPADEGLIRKNVSNSCFVHSDVRDASTAPRAKDKCKLKKPMYERVLFT